eukprot:TRINITY_DN13551_c0_g1_i1.p1 TRINITY_DN13551_c0_g1~~TRINITY_DN13551_c0_g1_i1.p1  ORF type:complete len:356 (-),score=55.50 TRINITY_DN13551_c0_g1_i1:50-1117(-)
MTQDEAMAIAFYTFEYGASHVANNPLALLSLDVEQLRQWQGYLWLLLSGLRRLPRELHPEGLFRSINVSVLALPDHQYIQGRVVTWNTVSSTSLDLRTGKLFLGQGQALPGQETAREATKSYSGTVFIIRGNCWGYMLETTPVINCLLPISSAETVFRKAKLMQELKLPPAQSMVDQLPESIKASDWDTFELTVRKALVTVESSSDFKLAMNTCLHVASALATNGLISISVTWLYMAMAFGFCNVEQVDKNPNFIQLKQTTDGKLLLSTLKYVELSSPISSLVALFKKVDTDGSGALSLEELKKGIPLYAWEKHWSLLSPSNRDLTLVEFVNLMLLQKKQHPLLEVTSFHEVQLQ